MFMGFIHTVLNTGKHGCVWKVSMMHWLRVCIDIAEDHFTEIALFMSKHEIENEKVMHIKFDTNRLEKIKFLR